MEYKNIPEPEKEGLLELDFNIEEKHAEIQDTSNSDNPQQFKEYLKMIITNLAIASNKEQILDCLKNFPMEEKHFYANHDIIKMLRDTYKTFEILCDSINITSNQSDFFLAMHSQNPETEFDLEEEDETYFQPPQFDELDNELIDKAFAIILMITHVSDEATTYFLKQNSIINIFFRNQKFYSELSFALGLRIISNLFVDMDTFMPLEDIYDTQYGNFLRLCEQMSDDDRMQNPEVRNAFFKLIFNFVSKFPSGETMKRHQTRYECIEHELIEIEEENSQIKEEIFKQNGILFEFTQSRNELQDLSEYHQNEHAEMMSRLNTNPYEFEGGDPEFGCEEQEFELERETIEDKDARITQDEFETVQKLEELEGMIKEVQQSLKELNQALSKNEKRRSELQKEKDQLSKTLDLVTNMASGTIQLVYNLVVSSECQSKGMKYLYYSISAICDRFEDNATVMFNETNLSALKVALDAEKDKSIDAVIDIYRILYQYLHQDVLQEFAWESILPKLSQNPSWIRTFVKFINEASDSIESFNLLWEQDVYLALINEFPSFSYNAEVDVTNLFINLVRHLPPEICLPSIVQNGVISIFMEMIYGFESTTLAENILHALIDINRMAFPMGQLQNVIEIYNELDMFDALGDQEITFPNEIQELREAICQ